MRGYFFVFVVLLATGFSFATDPPPYQIPYTITTPKALTRQVSHKIFLELYDAEYQISTVTIISKDVQTSGLNFSELFTPAIHGNGIFTVEYSIPFKNFAESRIELTFLVNVQKIGMVNLEPVNLVNKTVELSVTGNNFVFIETSKPVYKPKDKVQFRLLTILPQSLHPFSQTVQARCEIKQYSNKTYYLSRDLMLKELDYQTNFYESVVLESPSRIKMFEWKKMSWIDGLKGLTWKLSADPEFGVWKIIVNLEGQKESTTFKVEKYVLPRFIVDIEAPKIVTTRHKFLQFKICVKYNTGKSMKANVIAKLCVTHDDNNYHERNYVYDNGTYHYILIPKRPCVTEIKAFSGVRLCENFSVSTQDLKLENNTLYGWSQTRIKVNASVTELGSGMKIDREVLGGRFETISNFSVTLNVPDYFKHGLPFYGSLKVTNYDKQPLANFNISLAVGSYGANWNLNSQDYVSNNDGIVTFVISSFPKFLKSITIKVYRYDENRVLVQEVLSTATARAWFSPSFTYLQQGAMKQDQNRFVCTEMNSFAVQLQSNVALNHRTIFVKIQSKGEIVSLQTLPPISKVIYESCSDSDSEETGHYTCVRMEEGKMLVKCLPGWTGDNCLTAANNEPCYCLEAGKCKCSEYLQEVKIFHRKVFITIDTEMFPDSRAIFYFIYNNSEFVTHTVPLTGFAHCFMKQNPLSLTFPASTVLPKTKLSMTINGLKSNETANTCAWSLRDIATKSMGSTGEPSIDIISNKLQQLTQLISDSYSMLNPFQGNDQCGSGYSLQRDRMIWLDEELFDATKSLADAGLFMFSSFNFTVKPCVYGTYRIAYARSANQQYDMMAPESESGDTRKAYKNKLAKDIFKEMRSFFPEVWKFDVIDNPTDKIELTVPDSMTTWAANMFCVSKKFGLRITPESSLIVFQPFFIDLVLPYSLTRGEIADVPIKIFNYLPHCYGIIVQVIPQDGFETLSKSLNQFCLCDDLTFNLKIKGLKIGKVNVTLAAQGINLKSCNNVVGSNSETSATLSNINIENISDAIRKEILIEPEGIPQEITTGDLLCTKNGATERMSLQASLTENNGVVSDSIRGYAMWTGDVMGNTLNNLDKLIKLPYGCGEQNMMSMVPSIYVLQYFTSLNIDKPVAMAKAREYISYGYQRQLNYMLNDYSYSAFGQSDKVGSTWLTSFVFKSFIFASKFVDSIDPNVVNKTQKFILSKQFPEGCFGEDGYTIYNRLDGGVKADNKAILTTAYVIVAFLENHLNRSDLQDSVKRAVNCIKQFTHPAESNQWDYASTFSIALRAYALNLYNPLDPVSLLYNKILDSREKKSKAYNFWTAGAVVQSTDNIYLRNRWTSSDVETTAYALLAKLATKKVPIIQLIPVIKWLTTQRNSEGGWYSTQDTVVGLQAVSTFAGLVGTDKINLSLNMTTNSNRGSHTEIFAITEDNKSIFYENLIPEIPSVINFTITGEGCLVTQLNIKFNQVEIQKNKEPFSVRTEVIQDSAKCHMATLNVCAKTTATNFKSGMAIIKVKLVSGWEITQESITKLTDSFSIGGLRRLEAEKNLVTLYYDYMSNNETCTKLNLEKKVVVFNPKPASIQIYDYYSPDILTELFYNMSHSNCNSVYYSENLALNCPICKTFADFERACSDFNGFLVVGKKTPSLEDIWKMSVIFKNLTLGEMKSVKVFTPYECACKAPSMFVMYVNEANFELLSNLVVSQRKIDFLEITKMDLPLLQKVTAKCQGVANMVLQFLGPTQ